MTVSPRPLASRRTQRGTSLLESLVAFVVLAIGTIAAGHLQGQLRQGSDLARQRSEAARLGTEEMEGLRAFAAIAAASGVRSYAAIGDADRVVDAAAGDASNAAYRIARRIDDAAFACGKTASVTVHWNDRTGNARQVLLESFIARADPAYAGSLAIDAGAVADLAPGAAGRARSVPIEAKDLGNGRSVWKVRAAGDLAIVFDNASGDVVGRCDGVAIGTATRDLTIADVAVCSAGRWLLLAGTIRSTSAAPPSALPASELPPPLAVALTLTDGGRGADPLCLSETKKTVRYLVAGSLHVAAVPVDATPASAGVAAWTDAGDAFIAWHCLVAPRGDGSWSGRATLVADGWSIGTRADQQRVCRYSADADGSGAIDANIEHPRDYVDVTAALVAQNFLIVRGDQACPGAPRVRLIGEGSAIYADSATVQHQP